MGSREQLGSRGIPIGMGVHDNDYHENGGGNKGMGMGMNSCRFSTYHMTFCSVIRKLGKHRHFNFTLARPLPEHVIFTSLVCTVTD